MNEQTKKLIINSVIVLVVLIIGVFVGTSLNGKKGGENTYQAGWDAAKKRLVESGYAMPMIADVMNISGEVTEVKSDGVTVKIRPLEPLADPALDIRTVTFDANTKFIRMVQKDPVQYQKEVQAYNLKMQQSAGKAPVAAVNLGVPPQMFEQTDVKSSDIKKGDQVTISATQNIKDAKTFVAATVTLQTPPAAVAAPAPTAKP